MASDNLSGQQPNSESEQSFGALVVGTSSVEPSTATVVQSVHSHPSPLGPVASAMPSAQQPNSLAAQPPTVVVRIGQPSFSGFSASVVPSEQQPNKLLTHNASGHPSFFLPLAGDVPSGQQPYFVSAQVSGTVHPSSNGPVAAVRLSAQQPYVDLKQAAIFGRGLHFLGVCSFLIIASNVFGLLGHSVVDSSSSLMSVVSVSLLLDQMSTVVISMPEIVVWSKSVESDEDSTEESVESELPVLSVADKSVTDSSVADVVTSLLSPVADSVTSLKLVLDSISVASDPAIVLESVAAASELESVLTPKSAVTVEMSEPEISVTDSVADDPDIVLDSVVISVPDMVDSSVEIPSIAVEAPSVVEAASVVVNESVVDDASVVDMSVVDISVVVSVALVVESVVTLAASVVNSSDEEVAIVVISVNSIALSVELLSVLLPSIAVVDASETSLEPLSLPNEEISSVTAVGSFAIEDDSLVSTDESVGESGVEESVESLSEAPPLTSVTLLGVVDAFSSSSPLPSEPANRDSVLASPEPSSVATNDNK